MIEHHVNDKYVGMNGNKREDPISVITVSNPDNSNLDHGNISTTSSPASLISSDQKSAVGSLEEQKSPWGSLWLANIILMFTGIQFSIYFTSMWPFLQTLDSSTNLTFFGFVIAAYSVGQAVASPFFGYWNQKTKSTRRPIMFGMVLTIIGNLIYALLPTIPDNRKWVMLGARFLVGFGSGVVGVLRAFIATASTAKDRTRAVPLGTAFFTIGMSLGPTAQACFQPIGKKGWSVGSVVLNMYTVPSYFVIAGAILVIFLLQFVFVEKYAGIISDEEKKANPYMVLPKFDFPPALVCLCIWFLQQLILTNTEVILTSFTMAMYDWSEEEAVLYNGIILMVSSVISICVFMSHAFTRIGQIDSRKLILFGLTCFFSYHIITIPWPFFSGRLHYRNLTANITGGCETNYTWCTHTAKVPFLLFLITYVLVLRLGFTNIASPVGTLYSRILGPRKQGNMQGAYMFVGSMGRLVSPLFVANFFEWYGPAVPWAGIAGLVGSIALLVLIFYKRLVPLKTLPRLRSGDKIKYKMGTLYRL